MLVKRILTGIIGGAATIGIIYEGNWLFFIMMLLLTLLGWYEYSNLVTPLKVKLADRFGAVWLVLFFAAYWFGAYHLMMLLALVLMAWLLLRTVFFHQVVKPVDSAYSLYGIVYLGGGFLAMLALRSGTLGSYMTPYFDTVMLEPSRFIVFLLIFSTWASDTFAFAFGKWLGKKQVMSAN